MCGALEQEQGACKSNGKPKIEAGGTQAGEDAGEGCSAARPVAVLEDLEDVGRSQQNNSEEGSSPPVWGWVPRDSPPAEQAGEGRPVNVGPAREADNVQQEGGQQPMGPPLAGSSGGKGRGTPRSTKGTGAATMHREVTSVSCLCPREMVIDQVMRGKWLSDSCEIGINFAKFMGLDKRPTSVNCDYSRKTSGSMWWNVKTVSCEVAIRDPDGAGSGVVSNMFQGICPGVKTEVSFKIKLCWAVGGPQQKVDPGTSEASGQRQSKITPPSETWREMRGDTFTGGRCRSSQIQHGRRATPGSPERTSAERSSAPGAAPEVRGRRAPDRSHDKRSGQAAIRHGSIQAGNWTGSVFSETPCRMNNYSTRWSRYQLRRDIRRENPSIL